MIKICIIEDNEYMREGWQTILDFDPELCVIGVFGSCEDALKSDELPKTDILLLDIQLPGINGIEGVKIIKQKHPDIIVLMVTIHDDNERIFNAIKNGADGYLLKKVSPVELVAAVKVAYKGGSPMTPNIARKVLNSFQKQHSPAVELSDTEKKVLKCLAEGLSYKSISNQMFLSVDGVRYHIRHIYQKLEAKNRSEAVAKGINFINYSRG